MGARDETLEIPARVRAIIDERDGLFCRVCGAFQGDRRAIHHILYGGDLQGMGGRRKHDPAHMVTICWLPGSNDCHTLVHSKKSYWQPILLDVVQRPGHTALQLARWQRQQETRRAQGARDRKPVSRRPVPRVVGTGRGARPVT